MGKRGREIVDVDLGKLITELNKAYADEWLAYYQYLIGAKVVKGPMRGAVAAELEEHAGEELNHANMLIERIIQLGGTPLLEPQEWYKETNCGYSKPDNFHVMKILDQNIEGERCAIDVYVKLIDMVKGKDSVTYNMLLEILEDEIEHEEDLEAFVEDIEVIKEKI